MHPCTDVGVSILYGITIRVLWLCALSVHLHGEANGGVLTRNATLRCKGTDANLCGASPVGRVVGESFGQSLMYLSGLLMLRLRAEHLCLDVREPQHSGFLIVDLQSPLVEKSYHVSLRSRLYRDCHHVLEAVHDGVVCIDSVRRD